MRTKGKYNKYYTPRKKVHKGECPSNSDEIWKDIDGLDGWYMVSNHSRVWSWKRGQLLTPSITKGGYYAVSLNSRTYYLHRLVAEAFIPNPNNLPEIDHINTIRTDNRIENLRWVTRKENLNNEITLIRFKSSNKGKWKWKSKHSWNSKKVSQIDKDGSVIASFPSIAEAARQTNTCNVSIRYVLLGMQKTAGGYRWKEAV